jgi:hypothetical protein
VGDGRVLARHFAEQASCSRRAASYVRVRMEDGAGRRAWTQPVFRE